MNPEESQTQEAGSLFQKLLRFKRILIPLFILILILIPLTFLISSRNKSPESPPVTSSKSKMWKVKFVYNTEDQTLKVKSVELKEGRATASNSGLSPYKLQVLDKDNRVIYQTDIHITERILYNIYIPPEATGSAIPVLSQPKEFEDTVYIPYLSNAQRAQVLKQGKKILEFTFPKVSSFNLINQAYAVGEECTTNLKIVFVSDGYDGYESESKFNQDVDQISNMFKSLNPYSEKPEIFDFRSIFNTVSLGCKNGIGWNHYCFNDQTNAQVKDIVYTRFPELEGTNTDYLKFVVLVDSYGDPPPPAARYLGVANGPGGEFGMIAARENLYTVAPHEVLGHMVGKLWDRYIYPPSDDLDGNDKINFVRFKSNCTENSQGEGFWQSINGGGGHKGCTSEYLYAPYPITCINNGGTSESLMSAGQCNATQFDPVEKAWLKTNILPIYEACSAPGSTSTPSLTPTSSPTPTITSAPSTFSIPINFWSDNNSNGEKDVGDTPFLSSVKIDLLNFSGVTISQGTTSSGSYTFSNISPGTYNLRISITGYATFTTQNPIPITNTDYSIYILVPPIGPNPSPPVIVTPAPTPIPTQIPTPTPTPPSGSGGGGGGTGGASPTPTPTPITTYTCVEDRSKCSQGQNNLQLCPLSCTPNN